MSLFPATNKLGETLRTAPTLPIGQATTVNYMLTNLKFQMGLAMWMMEERFLMMTLMRNLQMVSEFISCIW